MTFSRNFLAEKKYKKYFGIKFMSQFQFLDQTFDWQEIRHKHTTEDAKSQPAMGHPGPARKLSTNLYDIYQCRVYSE
jgi:hypothetical protein